MLHNVYAALIAVDGFSPTSQVNSTGTAGNVIYLHLFMDALALQPCNPICTFFICFSLPILIVLFTSFSFCPVVTARDAWIQADTNRCEPIAAHHTPYFLPFFLWQLEAETMCCLQRICEQRTGGWSEELHG